MAKPLDHLVVTGRTESDDFKSTLSVRRPAPPNLPRKAHGSALLAQIKRLMEQEAELKGQRGELGLPAAIGITITLQIYPRGALDYALQLEWKRDGIEVLSATPVADDREIVVLHVPDGKLSAFETRIKKYLTENVKPKADKKDAKPKPKHATLINAIEQFRRAAFADLWTDEMRRVPAEDDLEWYQLWLRLPAGKQAQAVYEAFLARAQGLNVVVEPGYVPFQGRIVVAVQATRRRIQDALDLMDFIAEIRSVPPLAPFYLELKPYEQVEWVKDFLARAKFRGDDAPYVTLFDTGINPAHPLLQPALAEADLHAVQEAWGVTDVDGHGTEMAGMVLHGDLAQALASKAQHHVAGRLESVKIAPPGGANPPHLYGWVTRQAATKVHVAHPQRRRTYALMTTSTGSTYGFPSEWSATVDQVSYGGSDENPVDGNQRLFVLSAGNIPWNKWAADPEQNDNWSVENPGQAWNALTVGACTDLVNVDKEKWPSAEPLAKKGLLAPCSTTSVQWDATWPFKPDVVAEGGNGCHDGLSVIVGPADVRLVTTSHDLAKQMFTEAGDTSAAAAEVSRLCTHLQAQYPGYWPETLRGLVVHGARYTKQMQSLLPPLVRQKKDKLLMLRRFGYGRISPFDTLHSTLQQPTMVLQERIKPYKGSGAKVQLDQFNLHALPWPAEALRKIADADVALRVTLSYFVEPNPSRRGWQSKYRYQSHALRFAVMGSTEDEDRFLQRINKIEREALEAELKEGEKLESMPDPDGDGWYLGAQLRNRGSIHSDLWVGSAAQLAAKSHVAVFPVGGWWKDWAGAQRPQTVRYSLIVTLEALNNIEIDLYTPIATQLKVPIVVPEA